MKHPAKTLIFTMVSMALIACETPQKTESVVLLDPTPNKQINNSGQPAVKASVKDSVKTRPDQERLANTPAQFDHLVTSTIVKSKGTVGKTAEEQVFFPLEKR